MKIEQQNAEEFCKVASGFLESDDLKSALTNYQKALQLDDKCYDALLGSGIVYVKMAKDLPASETQKELYTDAINLFEKADSINPVEQKILRYMQEIYAAKGSSEKLRGINERIHDD